MTDKSGAFRQQKLCQEVELASGKAMYKWHSQETAADCLHIYVITYFWWGPTYTSLWPHHAHVAADRDRRCCGLCQDIKPSMCCSLRLVPQQWITSLLIQHAKNPMLLPNACRVITIRSKVGFNSLGMVSLCFFTIRICSLLTAFCPFTATDSNKPYLNYCC